MNHDNDDSPPNTPTSVEELLQFVADAVGEGLEHFTSTKAEFSGWYDCAVTGPGEMRISVGDEEFVVRVEKKVSA